MGRSYKKRAPAPVYTSPNQLSFEGFETPFEQQLDKDNRWIILGQSIPWDRIVSIYDNIFKSKEGREPLSGRLVLGSLMVKHLCKLSDRETITFIQENMYVQFFLGYTSFTVKAPFSATLFVEFRKRLTEDLLIKINDIIATHAMHFGDDGNGPTCVSDGHEKNDGNAPKGDNEKLQDSQLDQATPDQAAGSALEQQVATITNKGQLLMDATVAPQNITYPTDLKLLNRSREKAEEIIDGLFDRKKHKFKKPKTYRVRARKDFLNVSKKKRKTRNAVRTAIGKQIRYLRRDLKHIDMLLATYEYVIPLSKKNKEYLKTIREIYKQQEYMYVNHVNTVKDRIVNLHQPYVRPIVRGKEKAKVEFGSKMQASLVNGFVFIDKISWNAFNESTCLVDSVERYKKKFGFYPYEVLADQIYCTRDNRKELRERNIKLVAKPLGRPSAKAVKNHIRPGERNPIEGKFGQAKTRYGLDCIKAKLADTSTSWIATIAIVLNLVNLTRQALASLLLMIQHLVNKEFLITNMAAGFSKNNKIKINLAASY